MKVREDEHEDSDRRAITELREFSVDWDAVTSRQLQLLKACLRTAKDERTLQSYLEKHPKVLVQHLASGHGRWVIPRVRLGAKYIPDFVVGELNSLGFRWHLIELESPAVRLFTKAGDPSRFLNHAIRQIDDWRRWLNENTDFARRPRSSEGLGLKDIAAEPLGLILIGRRQDLSTEDNRRRRQMSRSCRIEIHTYDFLVDELSKRLGELNKRRNPHG